MNTNEWKNKIEQVARAGRRSSLEVLSKLIWNDNNSQIIAIRPHTSSFSSPSSSSSAKFYQQQRTQASESEEEENEEDKGNSVMVADDEVSAPLPLRSSIPAQSSTNTQSGIGMTSGPPENDRDAELDSLLISPGRNERRPRKAVVIPMSRTQPEMQYSTGRIDGRGQVPTEDGDRGEAKLWKSHGNHSMGLVLSALYAKLLVVMGMAFPLSEVMSTYIPAAYYDGFYLYLYFMSILFMIWVFGYIIREKARISARTIVQGMSFRIRKPEAIEAPMTNAFGNTAPVATPTSATPIITEGDKSSTDGEDGEITDGSTTTETPPIIPGDLLEVESGIGEKEKQISPHHLYRRHKGAHFGSFYLRMGAVAFGVGSMIYSGLEFGQYFELKSDSKCHNYLMALTPSVRMFFTFMQMYFIFLSSRMAVFKESLMSQFGLMHMIGTNLCVWLNVLVQETKHEILSFYDPDNKTITFKSVRAHQKFSGLSYSSIKHSPLQSNIVGDEGENGDVFYDTSNSSSSTFQNDPVMSVHHRITRGLKGPYSIHECGRTNIIGSIVQDAAPFLFPCTIEYSLICAAICYVMWKSMAQRRSEKIVHKHSFRRPQPSKSHVPHRISKSPHHYTVDCAASHKGLFLGIFVLVLTIMSLIINFVLVKHPDYRVMANLEAHITEIVLYTMATCAVIIGMCQIRALRYSQGRNLELDNILLIVAQTGSLIFNIFAIISGQFILKKGENLVLATALLKVIQLLLQTLFILDASKRVATTLEQVKKKPGREVVTFLLITNLAMWLINALEKSRGESHPAQLQFYGVWAWTIITHISMPLAIFYRFHSTVCLCEIWKRAYKMKDVVA